MSSDDTLAHGHFAVAIGPHAEAHADFSVALGMGAVAREPRSVVLSLSGIVEQLTLRMDWTTYCGFREALRVATGMQMSSMYDRLVMAERGQGAP